jgi:putative endonuclease
MNKDSYFLGKKGEEIAAEYIKSKGFFVAAKNYKSAHGEIDIIAEDDKTVVFVEVKSRTSDSGYLPREAVTEGKKKRIIFTARNYIYKSRTTLVPRFDIIEVILPDDCNILKAEINHIENAFEVNSHEFY